MSPRRYLAVAAGLIAAVALMGGQSATAAPAVDTAKAKSSWELNSTVNFSGSDLPDGCVKYTGKYSAGTSAWSEDNATLNDGKLILKVQKKKTDKQPYTTGGMGCWNWPQTYGKFEVRAMVPSGKGINSYITLSPASSTSSNALTSIELLAPDDETGTVYVSNGYGSTSEQAYSEQTFADKKWHTFTIEWAPKHLLVQMDGEEIYYSNKSFKGSRWISMATSTGDSLTGDPDKSTKLPKAFQITQMKIWTYTGTEPDPGETLSSEVTPTPDESVLASAQASAEAGIESSSSGAGASGADSTGQHLTGGVWPWLIGGSVMVVSALAILSAPRRRRDDRRPPDRRRDARRPPEPDPRGRRPAAADPYARRPGEADPYARRPADPGSYGQPPAGSDPYGRPSADPGSYGQPPADSDPYGRPPADPGSDGRRPPGRGPHGRRSSR